MDFRNDIENPSYSIALRDIRLKTDDYPRGREELSLRYIVPKNKIGNLDHWLLLSISYVGNDWRFMKGDIKIKLNDNLITLVDKEPYHSVLDGGDVLEIISVVIPDKYIKNNIDSITIQYYHTPITLSNEEVSIIKTFLSKNYGKNYDEMKEMYRIRQSN